MHKAVTLHGKPGEFNSDSITLWVDMIDGMVEQHDVKKLLSAPSIQRLQQLIRWVHDTDIPDTDVTLAMYSYKRMESYQTVVYYYLHLYKPEHRTLFLLCNDNIFEEAVA
jgi:hypothetical protein